MSRLGHRITRRQTLGLAGLAGAAYVTGCRATADEPAAVAEAQTPSCVLVPEVTEGPYFVDTQLKRADVRANSSGGAARPGIPLALTIRIVEVGSGGRCSPYAGAAVDIWHCDAEGEYSGVGSDTDFLRGYQVTDANGAVTFRTIFPGWYRGRAIHIHLKVRTYDGATETYEYTSQLFFSDTTIAQAYDVAPYSGNGMPDTSNAADGIYAETGGTSLVQMSGGCVLGLQRQRGAGPHRPSRGRRGEGSPARHSVDAQQARAAHPARAARPRRADALDSGAARPRGAHDLVEPGQRRPRRHPRAWRRGRARRRSGPCVARDRRARHGLRRAHDTAARAHSAARRLSGVVFTTSLSADSGS